MVLMLGTCEDDVFLLRLTKTVLLPKAVPLCVLPLEWSPGPC